MDRVGCRRKCWLSTGGWVVVAILATVASAPAQSVPLGPPTKGGHAKRAAELSSTDSLAVPPPITKTGCATFELRIDGEARVAVTRTPEAECGPISPVIVGIPSLDVGRGTVHIPVALHNGGQNQLHAPAWLTAPVGSIIVTAAVSPPSSFTLGTERPSAAPKTDPHYLGGDPHRDSVGAEPGVARWSYDTLQSPATGPLVTAADGSVVLPPDGTSEARSIDLAVPPGVTGLRITLKGFGTYVLTVAARPPDAVPVDELRDARSPNNAITDDPRFPGRTVRNKLWLLFRPGATAEQREAAIEAVNGIVVGGAERSTGNGYPPPHGFHRLRYYYVAFPAYPDSGAGPLERAIHTLALLPQVQDVRADILGQD